MLSEPEKREINEETKQYPYREAVCIDALKIVQHHRGWISDEAVSDIASELNLSVDEVDGIATFYTRVYRKPVGRNVILVCEGIACMIMDHKTVYDYISEKIGIKFGETTTDNRFTLLPVSCLGDCDHAPVLMVNGDHYNNLTTGMIDDILKKYL
jgi:NADH-quinone oxidoreductase subunit E